MAAAVLQRNERVEATRFVLQRAEPVEVVDAVFPAFRHARRGSSRWSGCRAGARSRCIGQATSSDRPFLRDRCGQRTGSSKISAPPPGIASMPASLSRARPLVRAVSPCLVDHIGQFDRRERLDRSLRQNPALDRSGSDRHNNRCRVARVHSADDVNLGSPAIAVRCPPARGSPLPNNPTRRASSRRSPVRTEPAVEDADVGRLDVEIAVIENGSRPLLRSFDARGQQPQQREGRSGSGPSWLRRGSGALRSVDFCRPAPQWFPDRPNMIRKGIYAHNRKGCHLLSSPLRYCSACAFHPR